MRAHTDGKALPIRACIGRFTGQLQERVIIQRGQVACRKLAPASENLGQTIHLDAADGCLDICQAIIVAKHWIVFEDYLVGTVTDGIWNGHPMLTQHA